MRIFSRGLPDRNSLAVLAVMVLLSLGTLAVPGIFSRSRGGEDQEFASGDQMRGTTFDTKGLKEAMFYEKLDRKVVRCLLCPRKCELEKGERGDCRSRLNLDGALYSLVYGKPCALSLEPIEKAPLFHFMPGHKRLCVATAGCNLRCRYCQNWHISQSPPEEVEYINLTPSQIVTEALANEAESICFTFSEPIVFYEYMYEIATLARERGLKTSMVSAGYINPEPLLKLLEALDAVKIDLKGFTEEFYEDITFGELEPILDTLRTIAKEGTWLEIVNLVVPTLNDQPNDIRRMCDWIREELGAHVPLHFSRFFPVYKLTGLPATPVSTLEKCHAIAHASGLRYVYIGNVPGHAFNSTYCPACGKRLIHRIQYTIGPFESQDGRCPECGETIEGSW
jgi:pyruvate formate lyase activating enzyme